MNGDFTFKRCLILCGPALLLGLWLRGLALFATPEAMLTADTNSYWDSVSRLWNDGKFHIPEKRRWLYPLLLMAAPGLPGNTPQAVAFAQHALGLCAIVGVGWIGGHLTRWRAFVVPLATLLFAASSRGLGYEHQIIADSAMTNCFVLAAAVAVPFRCITQHRLGWTLFLCAIVLALKPHGKPLALPLLVAAGNFAGVPWRWRWPNWLLAALCAVLFVSAGSSRQGGWLLLSSTLPLVPEGDGKYPQYRAALAPVIREARALGDGYPWHQFRYKKLLSDSESYDDMTAGQSFAEAGPAWNPLTRRKAEFAEVTTTLGRSGLRAHPWAWVRFTFAKIARGLANPETDLLAKLQPVAFWNEQRVRNEERWRERTKAIHLIYEMDRAEFDNLVAQRSVRTAPDVSTNFFVRMAGQVRWFTDDPRAFRIGITWIGVLGLFGVIASARRLDALPLLGALALSLGTFYGIGDAIPRYVYPVEWLLYLLPLLGVVGLVDAVLSCKIRVAR
jgi:hypothetical protein